MNRLVKSKESTGFGIDEICRLKNFQIVEHSKVHRIGFYETPNVLDKVRSCRPVKSSA